MGNRAVITTANALNKDGTLKGNELGIYVHWCGSKKVVERILKDAKEAGIRDPEYDNYGWARLCQLIANNLDSDEYVKGTGIGIDILDRLDCDNGDNGVYFIKDWKIVGRMYNPVED
jgi:hypothetical protein